MTIIMKKLFLPASMLGFVIVVGCNGQTPRGRQGEVTPVVLAKGQQHPAAIDVDETNVYWISDSRSAIARVRKTGGAVTAVVTGQQNIRRLIVDGDVIYFYTDDEIKRVSTSGGNPTTLVKFSDIGDKPGYLYLALDRKNVYFFNSTGKEEQVTKLDKARGKPTVLASAYAPAGLASDGVNVYWADRLDNAVKRVDVEGGPTVTVGACASIGAVAVDSTAVYCADFRGELLSYGKTNGTMTTLAAIEDAQFDSLAVDERNVYALSVIRGIYRIDKRGGPPKRLVPLDRVVASFSIDGTSLYWSNYDEGTVMRRPK